MQAIVVVARQSPAESQTAAVVFVPPTHDWVGPQTVPGALFVVAIQVIVVDAHIVIPFLHGVLGT